MGGYTPDLDGVAARARDVADPNAHPDGKPLPVERFSVKVARLADGPAAGRLVRAKRRAILVPFWLNGETEANPGPRPVMVFLRYRRAPGRFPDGAQRYIHVDKDGAW